METKWMDDVIYNALMKRKKVELFLCRDSEGGYGIKVEGKIAFRNLPCEMFDTELESEKELKLWEKYCSKPSQKTGGENK